MRIYAAAKNFVVRPGGVTLLENCQGSFAGLGRRNLSSLFISHGIRTSLFGAPTQAKNPDSFLFASGIPPSERKTAVSILFSLAKYFTHSFSKSSRLSTLSFPAKDDLLSSATEATFRRILRFLS